MDKTKNLTVRFISDTSKWRPKGIKRDLGNMMDAEKGMKKSFNGMGKSAKKLGKDLGKGPKGLSGGIAMVKENIMSMTGSMGPMLAKFGLWAAAGYAVYRSLSAVISAGSQAEDQIVKLTVLLGGSGTKALAMYQKALEFSVITPFDPRDVVDAAVVAGQYGADAFVTGLYGMKGNVAALVADMASFSGQTMEQAATALMRGDLALLEKYGAAGRAAYKTAKQAGELGSTAFLQTFVKSMSEVPLWMGMAEKKSQTLSGLWSTIQGNVGLIFTYLSGAAEGEGVITFWTNLKIIVKDFSDGLGAFVGAIRPLLVETGTLLGNVFGSIWVTLKLVWTILKPIGKILGFVIYTSLRDTLLIVNSILEVFIFILSTVTKVINALYSFLDSIFGISDGIKATWEWAQGIVTLVQVGGFFLKKLFQELTNDIVKFIMNLPKIFTAIGSGIGGFFTRQKNNLLEMVGLGDEGKREAAYDTVANAVLNPIDTVSKFLDRNTGPTGLAAGKLGTGPISTVNQIQSQTDNSNTTTNVFNQGNDRPEWLIENPYDITGRPQPAV